MGARDLLAAILGMTAREGPKVDISLKGIFPMLGEHSERDARALRRHMRRYSPVHPRRGPYRYARRHKKVDEVRLAGLRVLYMKELRG